MSSQGGSGEVRMLIDGELVEAASGKRFDNVNPASEEVLGQVADVSADDMRRAIAAARRASSTSRTGRPTTPCASGASSSCRRHSSPSARSSARRSSPRWGRPAS